MPGTPRVPSVPKSSLGMSEESLTCGASRAQPDKNCSTRLREAPQGHEVCVEEIVRHKTKSWLRWCVTLLGTAWVKGTGRASHGNTANVCTHQRIDLQLTGTRGCDHLALLLLPAGGGHHSAAFDFAGVLPGPCRRVSRENAGAPNHRSHGHRFGANRGVGSSGLRIDRANRRFCGELAEIQQHVAPSRERRGRKNQRFGP